MYRVLEALCFLVICTKINCVWSEDTSVFTERKDEWIKPIGNKNLSIDEYLSGLNGANGVAADETVRHFLPIKGRQKWLRKEFPFFTEILLFNTSVIGDGEEVTSAQLHLHRRRLMKTHERFYKRYLPSPYRVVLYQVQPNYRYRTHEDARTMKLASLPVSHRTKGGWHTLDVTPVIRELLINAQGPFDLFFGVQFEAPAKPDGSSTASIVSLKHFLRTPNVFTPQHPYKTPCYLVVYSENDPFFDYFQEDYDEEEKEQVGEGREPSSTDLTATSLPQDHLKQRHLKHKVVKGKQDEEPLKLSEKSSWKYNPMENEVVKTKKKDEGKKHKSTNKGNELKRSKADELALKEKTKLKSLPFLHANEVDDIRQTSRRLTRSSLVHRNRKITQNVRPNPS